MKPDNYYEEIKKISKLLDDAEVPTKNRTMRMSHQAFIQLGGTEKAWKKLNKEQRVRPDNHLKLLYGIAIVLVVLLCIATYVAVKYIGGLICLYR